MQLSTDYHDKKNTQLSQKKHTLFAQIKECKWPTLEVYLLYSQLH